MTTRSMVLPSLTAEIEKRELPESVVVSVPAVNVPAVRTSSMVPAVNRLGRLTVTRPLADRSAVPVTASVPKLFAVEALISKFDHPRLNLMNGELVPSLPKVGAA